MVVNDYPGASGYGPTNWVQLEIIVELSKTNTISAQFKAWNAAISLDCSSGFWVEEAYCVGVSSPSATPTTSTPTATQSPAPDPTQANSIVGNCNKYAEAISGEGCESIAQENGITPAELYEWNAVLGSDGANCGTKFWAHECYCVGVVRRLK